MSKHGQDLRRPRAVNARKRFQSVLRYDIMEKENRASMTDVVAGGPQISLAGVVCLYTTTIGFSRASKSVRPQPTATASAPRPSESGFVATLIGQCDLRQEGRDKPGQWPLLQFTSPTATADAAQNPKSAARSGFDTPWRKAADRTDDIIPSTPRFSASGFSTPALRVRSEDRGRPRVHLESREQRECGS